MAINNTGEADIDLIAGGKTSSGPKEGVYLVKVSEVAKGVSNGDEKSNPPRPKRAYLELTLVVSPKDKVNASKVGKKLCKTRVYFPHPSDDEDKFELMNGMVKAKLFDGFGIPWKKEKAKIDPRIVQNKEVYAFIKKGKPDKETGERRSDVQNFALTADKLPKTAREWLEAAKTGKAPKLSEDEEESSES